MIRRRVLVSGRVQGVFFRHSARELARDLGLAGTVRNLADGRVEAIFEGAEEAVEKAVAWCREGPRGAEVSGVEVSDEPAEGLDSFRVIESHGW